MSHTTNINKIKSNYILKSLFSYISYKKILKLVKINKNLQSRLGIKLENYSYKLNFPKYVYIKEKKVEQYQLPGVDLSFTYMFLFTILMTILCFPYDFIYSLLLICLKTFDDNNIKKDYNKSVLKTIKILNIYIFISNFFIIGIFIVFYFALDSLNINYIKPVFLLLFFDLISLIWWLCYLEINPFL